MGGDASSEAQDSGRGQSLIGPGAVVLVVGPSGAGKDALLSGAREAMTSEPGVAFIERVISRPLHIAEAHASISETEFRAASRKGAYALSWRAHGLEYGIPVSINDDVARGRSVVFNASRSIVDLTRRRYLRVRTVLIDCPVEIRSQRLAARGRESAAEIRSRLTRTVHDFDPATVDWRIENAGPLEDGVAALVAVLRSIVSTSSEREAG